MGGRGRAAREAVWLPRIGPSAWRVRSLRSRDVGVCLAAAVIASFVTIALPKPFNGVAAAVGIGAIVAMVVLSLWRGGVEKREICRYVGVPENALAGRKHPAVSDPVAFDAWLMSWRDYSSPERPHVDLPRPGSIVAHTAMIAALGWVAGDLVIAAVASAGGFTRGAPWVAAIALPGVVIGVMMLVIMRGWDHRFGTSPSAEFTWWWRSRGKWLVGSSGVPVFVALAIAGSLHQR